MAATAPATTSDLIALIRKADVLHPSVAATLGDLSDYSRDPHRAVAALVQQKILTPFQARMLLAGKARGYRIGDYRIQDQIGQGGMGAVYKAIHQTLNRVVAIKILPLHLAGDKLALERFLREARTAAALDHPNIVKLFDVGKQDEIHFIALEYVEGQSLDKILKLAGGLSPTRAVQFIAQAAAGLQHAFEKGFIHRDIKPSNLILAKGETLKILDMGLARSTSADDHLTKNLDRDAVVGTADYIAPEQAMNAPDVDIRADIYSLGVTFFALVTGKPPYEGSTASKLIQHQMKAAPTLSKLDKTFPPKLSLVIAKMMAKKPGDRFQTPMEVIDSLEPWLEESPSLLAAVSAGKTSSRRLAAPKAARFPLWIWIAMGSAAVLAVTAAVVAIAILIKTGS